MEACTALGTGMEPAGTAHVERLNGALRDRLGALTCKTHAFAKQDASLRWAREFAAFRPQLSSVSSGVAATRDGVHRSHQRSPAMALGLTEHQGKKSGSWPLLTRGEELKTEGACKGSGETMERDRKPGSIRWTCITCQPLIP